MKWLIGIFLILVYSNAYAELLSYKGHDVKPIGVADGLLKFELNYAKSHYTLDVINEFAHQMRVESQNADEYTANVKYYFTEFIFVNLDYKYSEVEFENSQQRQLEKNQLEYHDYHLSGGFNVGAISLRLGYGGAKYHSFLETDTNLYFHDELKSEYVLAGFDYKFETKFGFDVEMFLDMQTYFQSTVGSYTIDEGFVRKWGGRMTVSTGRYQYGLGYIHTHRNVKLKYDFFTLENEMNNKLTTNQFLFFITAGF